MGLVLKTNNHQSREWYGLSPWRHFSQDETFLTNNNVPRQDFPRIFSPSLFDSESRPFLVEPPPFCVPFLSLLICFKKLTLFLFPSKVSHPFHRMLSPSKFKILTFFPSSVREPSPTTTFYKDFNHKRFFFRRTPGFEEYFIKQPFPNPFGLFYLYFVAWVHFILLPPDLTIAYIVRLQN